jgi:18S rRNA (guanine1575-N7)-methyltransferase
MIMTSATKAGFGGGLVVDYPNSKKAKKFYLVLWSGGVMVRPRGMEEYGQETAEGQELPQALTAEHEQDGAAGGRSKVKFENKRERDLSKSKSKRARKGKDGFGMEKGSKEWVLRKKELYRKRGKEDVPTDSKFTGRKRKPLF